MVKITLEESIEELTSNYYKNKDDKVLEKLYNNIKDLCGIFIRSSYPDIPYNDQEEICHDVCSSILMRNIITPSLIKHWHTYVKRSVKNRCASYIKQRNYRNVYLNLEEEDCKYFEMDITAPQEAYVYIMFEEVGNTLVKEISSILSAMPYKNNILGIIQRLVIMEVSGRKSIIEKVPWPHKMYIRDASIKISEKIKSFSEKVKI